MLNKFVGHENEIRRQDIISVQINLLNRCASRCKSCRKYTWPDYEWDVEELKNVIRILKNNFGLQTIFFCGGDPVLYKDFENLINFLVEEKIDYSLITTLIVENDSLISLIAKTAYRIHVSVDSVDRENYRQIRGVDGFYFMKKNLELINKVKADNATPVIRFSSTIGCLNYKELYNIYEFGKNNNCLVRFNYLRTWDGLTMSKEQEKGFHDGILKILEDEQNSKKAISNARDLLFQKIEDNKCKKCYLSKISAVIDSDGSLYPCCWILDEFNLYENQKKSSYGNIKGKSEEEIIKEFEKRLNVSYPIPNTLCDNCVQYYGEVLKDLENIFEDNKEKLFI